jgi:hypothetical protein
MEDMKLACCLCGRRPALKAGDTFKEDSHGAAI